jgi:predicted NBD/HSP70 family sugar kinase
MTSLGIDIGGSSVKLALVGDAGETVWKSQSAAYAQPTRQQLAEAIRSTVAGRFAPRGAAVGVCVPGTRTRGSHVVLQSVNLPALNGLNLHELVREAVAGEPRHIDVATDAVATAFDIYATQRLTGRLCAIALGTGIGLGVIDDGGVPLEVHGESPGHIGQMDVSLEGEPVIGPDGGAGSLEGYLGAPAILKRYGPDMAANLANLGAKDPPVRALVRAIRICHAIYVPQHVALVGGIGIRLAHLLPLLKKMVESELTRIADKNWSLMCGSDEFHAAGGVARFAAARGIRK